MRKRICEKCGEEFPLRQMVDGQMKELYQRQYCLSCFPIGQIVKPHDEKLTDIQGQILNGHLLGDGGLIIHHKGINAAFRLERKLDDLKYLEWSYEYFRQFCSSGLQFRQHQYKGYSKILESVYFRTKCLPIFTEYHNKWYVEGKKIIPKDLILTPLVLAVWFADDGYVKNGYSDRTLFVELCTHSFPYEDVTRMAEELKSQYNIDTKIYNRKGTKQYSINITSTQSCKYFFRLIDDNFPLERKSKIWRANEIDLWDKNFIPNLPCIFCQSTHNKKLGFNPPNKRRYLCHDCGKIYMALEEYSGINIPKAVRQLIIEKEQAM